MTEESKILDSTETPYGKAIIALIKTHGGFYFLKQALQNQNSTKHIIQTVEFKILGTWIFFCFLGVVMFSLGLSGFFKSMPLELTFFIPFGIVVFLLARWPARKIENALHSLSEIAIKFGKI